MYFLATGRFKIYGADGMLLTDSFFIKKVFKVEHVREVRDRVFRSIRRRAYLKYGLGTKMRQVYDLRVVRHSGIVRKRKKKK